MSDPSAFLGWDIGGVNTKAAIEAAFPSDRLHVYTVDGRFVSPHAARADPGSVDRDMLDDSAIDAIATALAGVQVRTIAEALGSLRRRRPEIPTAVVTGLAVLPLAEKMGAAAQIAPAAAMAWLLRQSLDRES
jgi:uncharacterized hydantoinase/oxoprolinase family protein